MRTSAHVAAIHFALWNNDRWYRLSWLVGLWSLAVLLVGFICVSKPNAGPSPGSWARPLTQSSGLPVKLPPTNGSGNASPPSGMQNQFERCFSKTLGLNLSMASCSALINTPQVTGKQLAAALTQRGFLRRENDPDRALVDYETALKTQPDFVDALSERAWIYMTRRQYDAALADLDKAISLSPPPASAAVARYYRGFAQLKLKNFSQAQDDLNEALKLQPNNADYYLARGEVQQALQNYDAALRDFDEFSKRAPKDAQGLIARGAVLEAMGKPQEALAALESAVKLSPDNDYAVSERDRLRGQQNAADPPKNRDEPPK
jgi:tetratricopeptide (TPR) repeat protein